MRGRACGDGEYGAHDVMGRRITRSATMNLGEMGWECMYPYCFHSDSTGVFGIAHHDIWGREVGLRLELGSIIYHRSRRFRILLNKSSFVAELFGGFYAGWPRGEKSMAFAVRRDARSRAYNVEQQV